MIPTVHVQARYANNMHCFSVSTLCCVHKHSVCETGGKKRAELRVKIELKATTLHPIVSLLLPPLVLLLLPILLLLLLLLLLLPTISSNLPLLFPFLHQDVLTDLQYSFLPPPGSVRKTYPNH